MAHNFKGKKLKATCGELGIHIQFSTPYYPQANGQVEAVNKTIKKNMLKGKLDAKKELWADELKQLLWSSYTITKIIIGETSFSLA